MMKKLRHFRSWYIAFSFMGEYSKRDG